MAIGDARLRTMIGLWTERGCPEKMTIHVKSTGERILLLNGSPVTLGDDGEAIKMPVGRPIRQKIDLDSPSVLGSGHVTLTRVCGACGNDFTPDRQSARFCSPRCRVKYNRQLESDRKREEQNRMLAGL